MDREEAEKNIMLDRIELQKLQKREQRLEEGEHVRDVGVP